MGLKEVVVRWREDRDGSFSRPMVEFVYKHRGWGELTGVEIGVDKGDNAIFILKTLPIKRLYLIDPYLEYDEFKTNIGWEHRKQSDFDFYFRLVTKRLKDFGDRVVFIRKKSEDAIREIEDGLDFVYIDGNHYYNFIKSDIDLYYPKLKKGGVFGGDNFESIYPSVARAVLEFSDKYKLKIHGARSQASYEWWVIKE